MFKRAPISEPAPSAAPLPRWLAALVRLRFLLAAIYVAGLSFFARGGSEIEPLPLAITVLIFFGMQGLLLLGAPQWSWPRPTGRRRMATSILAGSLMAGLLSVGLAATLLSLLRADSQIAIKRMLPGLMIAVVIVPWAFWLFLFAFVWMGEQSVIFRRMYRVLIAGTVLELLITIPVDAHVRRRTSCYCDEGTFLAMIIGVTMAFWTFGPGVVILFLVRRNQRRPAGLCRRCGYDLRGLTSFRCPECGVPFDNAPATSTMNSQ